MDFESYRWIIELCSAVVLPALGWIVGRRQQNNTFLGELQESINLLAAKNGDQMNEILKLREEIIKLRSENLEQSKEIAAQSREIASLKKENGELKKQVADLQEKLSGIKTITREARK